MPRRDDVYTWASALEQQRRCKVSKIFIFRKFVYWSAAHVCLCSKDSRQNREHTSWLGSRNNNITSECEAEKKKQEKTWTLLGAKCAKACNSNWSMCCLPCVCDAHIHTLCVQTVQSAFVLVASQRKTLRTHKCHCDIYTWRKGYRRFFSCICASSSLFHSRLNVVSRRFFFSCIFFPAVSSLRSSVASVSFIHAMHRRGLCFSSPCVCVKCIDTRSRKNCHREKKAGIFLCVCVEEWNSPSHSAKKQDL